VELDEAPSASARRKRVQALEAAIAARLGRHGKPTSTRHHRRPGSLTNTVTQPSCDTAEGQIQPV
jgi:hypothetical protein